MKFIIATYNHNYMLMSLLSLGAINKITKEYTCPKLANKKNKYMCIQCNKDVIPKQGKILRHHFAHKSSTSPCNYYSHPSESQIHKDAKMLLKQLLNNNYNIKVNRKCICCEKNKKFSINKYDDFTSIYDEYRFEYNNSIKIADVACVYDNEPYCIFEILNTHKTNEENRPSEIQWFEIKAFELINVVNENINNINMKCL